MGRRRTAFVARTAELAMLDAALVSASDGGRLVLLRGPAGIGKSALVAAATRRWRVAGVQIIGVSGADRDNDPLGSRAIVDAVRDHFEQIDRPGLAGSIEMLGRLSADRRSPTPVPMLELALELRAMFELIADGRPTVLLVDDVNAVAAPALALEAVVAAGCLVVATGTGGAGPDAGGPGMTQLATVADQILDLTPLADDHVGAMIAQARGAPLDDGMLPALRSALGPLVGLPGTVLSTVNDLHAQGRLAVVGGHLCLVDPTVPIALPKHHDLVSRTRALGMLATRLATTVSVTPFGVDDLPLLAEATAGRLADYGRLVDRLVEDGVLIVDAGGGLHPRCAAFANRMIADAGPMGVQRLHRTFAAALLRRIGLGARADRALLADHVTWAGHTIPLDERTAAWLGDIADAATDGDNDRVASWLRAALWHTGAGPATGQIFARLVRLLVRTGQFERLTEVVEAAITALAEGAVEEDRPVFDQDQRADLATAAVLAAVHTGRPVDGQSRLAPATDGPFDLRAYWFAEGKRSRVVGNPAAVSRQGAESLLSAAELARITSSLTSRPVDDGPVAPEPGLTCVADDAVLAAGSLGDLVTVFRLVLGPRYGTPTIGVLAAYHRLLRSYGRGDFAGALSAAREVKLAGAPSTVVHQLARLLAAEAHALQGNHRLAAASLASASDGESGQALRAWVAVGLADRFGEHRDRTDAIREGWLAYESARERGDRIGVEQLLPRLAELAVREGDRSAAHRVLAEAEALYQSRTRRISNEAVLMVRAVVHRDLPAAARAVELTRRRGDQPALVTALLAIGERAEDPRPWLLQAYEVGRSFDSAYLRTGINAVMRKHGVSVPRTRAHRERLSAIESQVVELIRRGLTNRQVAAALRMSEKTVENHLTRLFARTGCRSRVELATASLSGHVLGAAS